MAKIEIERVAERGAGLSGGREMAKNFGGAEQGGKAQMRGAMAPLGPPQLRPCHIESHWKHVNPTIFGLLFVKCKFYQMCLHIL